MSNASTYRDFSDLAAAQIEDKDFRIVVIQRPESTVAIVAPHGGGIEAFTSQIARDIAGEEFNLYLLEGIRPRDNYLALHLTSHRFDEPRALQMLAGCDTVVSVHGCSDDEKEVLIGGRDELLKAELCAGLTAIGVEARLTRDKFAATDPLNICNRCRSGQGVQLEIPLAVRSSAAKRALLASAVREALCARMEDPR